MAGRKRAWLRKRVATGRIRLLSSSAAAAARRSWEKVCHSDQPHRLLVLIQNYLFYSILWVVEAVSIAATICFFYLRFGYRL